ncbi:IclR family transcriptional regulator [Curtobacterium sp. VKM Ac-1376]|uniref:IclR family transcriptional regulator n=1 Tax=Curtobacterium sp. VKM Ac-1376 TaxID=123312 RepID=UPI001889C78E|nr:helix-turn-helix domain-containing protein [Curtobacterium sp. VKM Ac-1376]MBF4616015.1 helix-turn-helix domain-containing protein [Curtobacterium sp. VKM Ac-1376]
MPSSEPRALDAPSQTLSRGIAVLEVLADVGPLSIDGLANRLGLHRSVVYRLVRTLEAHGLVVRGAEGLLRLGLRLAALARGIDSGVRAVVEPVLAEVATELGMTAFVVVHDHGECVTLESIEPPRAVVSVAQHPGTRHPLGVGAPGLAIARALDGDTAKPSWQASSGEVIPGLRSVAVPLSVPGWAAAALAVVFIDTTVEDATIGARLEHAVERVQRAAAAAH